VTAAGSSGRYAASESGEVSLLARAAASLGWDLVDLVPAEIAALVTIGGGRLEFRHPLARSAIYADAAPDARRAGHRALARRSSTTCAVSTASWRSDPEVSS
jgi:hypothetical protein